MIRNKQYRIRMTNEEFEDLDRLAKKVGLKKSDMIRHALVTYETAYDILKGYNDINIREIDKNICNISISSNKKILSGKTEGFTMRRILDLDELESRYNHIIINIDSNIISFNTSYFLGLFKYSKNNLKSKEDFLHKYTFDCNEYLSKDIKDGINELYKRF